VSLEVSSEAKARLVELGYHPALGARPLRRAILENVQDPLAEKLLDKAVAEGTTLGLHFAGGEFTFDVRT
jgi:ATP-dependent Clp protease ATP-binding subunit ClpA